ncbi:MAG: HNH endonuclease [Gemmatimonadaceae bacterium]|nr:HNH endonuclease [Gemmatimonadaceae bacterium]
MTMADTFWGRVQKGDGCWLWAGTRSTTGYGLFNYQRKQHRAHRLAYVLVNGDIPAGLVPDHLCRNKLCVNPAHMEIVTPRENTVRGIGPTAQNAHKRVCKCGRPYDYTVTKANGETYRACRECRREQLRRRTSRYGYCQYCQRRLPRAIYEEHKPACKLRLIVEADEHADA